MKTKLQREAWKKPFVPCKAREVCRNTITSVG